MPSVKPVTARYNPNHPLSRDLTAAWIFNETAPNAPVIAYGPNPVTGICTSFVSSGRVATPYGYGLNQNSDGAYVAAPARTDGLYIPKDDYFTYAILAKFNNTAANYGPISTCQSGNYGWNLYFNGTSRALRITIGYGTGNFNYTKAGSPTISDNTWIMLGFSYDGIRLDAHYDGYYYNFNANAARPVASTIPLRIVQANLNGQVAGAWLWRRRLTPDELSEFNFDPWAMVRPARRLWKPAPVVSGLFWPQLLQSGEYGGY